MPLVTKFDKTLFADDTYLNLADINLSSLEHKVHEELNILNGWFCKNKLSINHTNTNYLLKNKIPHKPENHVFNLPLSGPLPNRVSEVKYLRWSPRGHILKSLALASKPQVLKNCPVLGSKSALFFEQLKFCWKTPETSQKICEHLFCFPHVKHSK